ncbi:MAG: hypothetical protein IJ587_09110 [Synergistaceae bacterium]|nr:hypothetical protein [Synergistaceae bacterium]
MKLTICSIGLFLIMAVSIYSFLDFMYMKTIQRIRLLECYSRLYFALKINYKNHDKSTLFKNKNDLLCFRSAFKQILPYIKGLKKWSDLSDWNLGMLIEAPVIATEKYSHSNVARFLYEHLWSIMQRSVVLMFPIRIYIFMHFENKNNKFLVGDIDLTAIKEEFIDLSKTAKINKVRSAQEYNKKIVFSEYLHVLRRKRKNYLSNSLWVMPKRIVFNRLQQ